MHQPRFSTLSIPAIDPRVCMHLAQSHEILSQEPEFFQWNNSKESGNKITIHVMCAETEWGALAKYQWSPV